MNEWTRGTSKEIGRGKVLQRTHLLNYFKKLGREFQRETSSGDEDCKSSCTDLERFVSKSNGKGRWTRGVVESSSSSSSSSSLLRGTSKPSKEFRETCNSFKDRSSAKHRLTEKECYDKAWKSVDRASSTWNRDSNSKTFRQCRRKNADKCSNIRKARSFGIGDSWSEGNVEKLRNNDGGNYGDGTTCNGSSVPLLTTERVASVRACTYSNRKCLMDIFDSPVFTSKCALRRIIPGPTVQFLVGDDLNHSDILHCEELLKHERGKREKNEKSLAYKKSVKDYKTRDFYPGTYSPVWKGDYNYQPKRRKNRKSFGRNNDRINTLPDEHTSTVTWKNNASAYYKRRNEEEDDEEVTEQVEELCKLVNTCRDGKRFSCFYEPTPDTQEMTLQQRSEYCLCPEYADTSDRLEISLSKHGVASVKNGDNANETNVCRAAVDIFQLNREEGEGCVREKYERDGKFVGGLNRLYAGKNFPPLMAKENWPLIESANNNIMSCDKLESSARLRYSIANERNRTNKMTELKLTRQEEVKNVRPVQRKTHDSCSRIEPPAPRRIRKPEPTIRRESNVTCCCLFPDCDADNDRSNERACVDSSKSYLAESSRQSSRNRNRNRNVYRCCYENDFPSPLERKDRLEKLRVQDESKASRGPSINFANVTVVKPEDFNKTNMKKVLVYPPRREAGPPLTLYKNASNISCTVKGDTRIGFRYNVTYTQKFASPAWYPEKDEWTSFSNTQQIHVGVTVLPTTAESHRLSTKSK